MLRCREGYGDYRIHHSSFRSRCLILVAAVAALHHRDVALLLLLVVVFCGQGGRGGGGGGHFRGVTPGQREPFCAAAPVLARGDREQFVNALEALVEEVLQEQMIQ